MVLGMGVIWVRRLHGAAVNEWMVERAPALNSRCCLAVKWKVFESKRVALIGKWQAFRFLASQKKRRFCVARHSGWRLHPIQGEAIAFQKRAGSAAKARGLPINLPKLVGSLLISLAINHDGS